MHNPQDALAPYIGHIVYYEGYSAEHLVDKLLPDGSIHIIIDMEDSPKRLYFDDAFKDHKEFSKAYVSGQHQGFMYIDAKVSSMMVISFKIGGAYPFFDIPMAELNNKVEHLEHHFGHSIFDIRDRIKNEPDITAKFELIEEYLLSRKKQETGNEHLAIAIKQLLNDTDNATTKQLAAKAGISQKHLIHLFRQMVGLNPKILVRILRFQKVVQKIDKQEHIDWTSTAYECGYYDQSHFIKDFYAFSGIRPSGYPSQQGEFTNYIPMN